MIEKEKKKLLGRLEKLERYLEKGKISHRKYKMLKREYQKELEAMKAAEKIKRMQGRFTVERPLEHWVEKAKKEEEIREKDELMKKYVKEPPKRKNVEKSRPNLSIIGVILILLAFFMGSGLGIYLLNLNQPSETGPIIVNESAFPTFKVNNTTPTCQTVPYGGNTLPISDSSSEYPVSSTPSETPTNSSR